jgi:transposase-like protein
MYSLSVRQLVVDMIKRIGIVRTSRVTGISRTTLWRWRRFGIVAKKRLRLPSQLFTQVKEALRGFLITTQCTHARDIRKFLFSALVVKVSANTVYKYIKKLGFSRKRTRLRGQCKGDMAPIIQSFKERFMSSVLSKTLVSVDECSFNERLHPLYGYSPVGSPRV